MTLTGPRSLTVPDMTVAATPCYATIPHTDLRRQLIVSNESSVSGGKRVYASWHLPVDGGAFNGFFIEPGATLVLGHKELSLFGPLFLACASGTTSTVYWEERV